MSFDIDRDVDTALPAPALPAPAPAAPAAATGAAGAAAATAAAAVSAPTTARRGGRVRVAWVAVLATTAVALSLAGPAAVAMAADPTPAPTPTLAPTPALAPTPTLGAVPPAADQPAAAPEVDGVEVGWLPAGVQFVDIFPGNQLGYDTVFGTFEGNGVHVEVTVQRSTPDTNIDLVAESYTQYYGPDAVHRVPLRGTEAVALDNGQQGGIFELTWVEGTPAVVLTVRGSTSGTDTTPPTTLPEADLRRIADSLTVGPAPTPTPWQQLSDPLVRLTVGVAFNGTRLDPRVPLSAVQNGSELVEVLEQFREQYPTVAATATVVVDRILFTADDRAWVPFTISFDLNGTPASYSLTAETIVVDGAWKVSEESYRNVLNLGGTLPTDPA